MIRCFKILIVSIILFSCESNEPVDLLTKGTWLQNDGFNSLTSESIKFKPDHSYVLESRIAQGKLNAYYSIIMSGNWSRLDNEISFVSSNISMPSQAEPLPDISSIEGFPLALLYGNLFSNPLKQDSLLNEVSASSLGKWKIMKLTSDSLVIESDGKTFRYYND